LQRIRQLDGLRAGAFLAVFFHHALGIPLLWMGVDLFFILSGFLITSILIRESGKSAGVFFGSFYFRRARRILPPYVLFLLVAGLCIHFEWGKIWYWYAFFAVNIAEALGRGGGGVLGQLWSLSVEEQFYLCWPLLVYFVPLNKLHRVLFAFVLAAPIARGLATPFFHTHFPIYYLTPFRVDLLAAGGSIAWLTHHDPAWPKKYAKKALMAAAASLTVFAVCAFRFPSFRTSANSLLFNTAGYTLIGLLLTSLLIASLALPQNRLYRFLTTPALLYLGKISYMSYLIHELALTLFGYFAPLVKTGCALAATIGFATLSWELMERRLVQRKAERRPAAS